MVAGDAVNAIGGDNAILDFQPAAGVEVCITTMHGTAGGFGILYNGANTSDGIYSGANPIGATKMFINNTNYLRMPAAGAGRRNGYTGVQTK